MFYLSSYNLGAEDGIRSDLNREFGPKAQLEEGVFADTMASSKGSFVRFQGPDWPDELRQRFCEKIDAFHKSRPYLQRVESGTIQWDVIFGGSVSDREATKEIAQIFERPFPGQVAWVRCDRDLKGKIKASVSFTDRERFDFCLSWNSYSVFGIGHGLVNSGALGKAIEEVFGLGTGKGRRVSEDRNSALPARSQTSQNDVCAIRRHPPEWR